MKIPSLVMGLLYVLAFAGIQAATDYFVTGEGATYAFAAVIVAILGALGRWLQEQRATAEVTTVTDDGTVMRSARSVREEPSRSPAQEALFG